MLAKTPSSIMADKSRFQFSLRSIFLVNIVFALLASAVRVLMSPGGEAILVAPAAWLLGVTGVFLLGAVGEACGRDIGSIIGIVLGFVIWTILVLIVSSPRDQLLPENPGAFMFHLLGVLFATSLLVWSVIHRMLNENSSDQHFAETTKHLLDDQRQRHSNHDGD
jgi:hypothetical protein